MKIKFLLLFFFSFDLNPIEYQNALKHVFNKNKKKKNEKEKIKKYVIFILFIRFIYIHCFKAI